MNKYVLLLIILLLLTTFIGEVYLINLIPIATEFKVLLGTISYILLLVGIFLTVRSPMSKTINKKNNTTKQSYEEIPEGL